MRKTIAGAAVLLVAITARVPAQTNQKGLAYEIPNLYGSSGLTLPNSFHRAHFTTSFQRISGALNTALASQVASLPIVSPASGFVFTFNPSLGVATTTSESYGPILTERAETIGRHRAVVAVTYQFFDFTSIDGIDLKHIPAVFTHQQGTGPDGSSPAYEQDFVSTESNIGLRVHQTTAFGTFGITDRFDLSVAVPFLDVHFQAASAATIDRIAPPTSEFNQGEFHFFDPNNPVGSTRNVFPTAPAKTHASGIGDVTFRAKWRFYRGERGGIALAGDFRAPTGDKYNFLGAGTYGLRPFLAFSYRTRHVAPHLNIGYQWNGKTVLAGDVLTNTKARLPTQAFLYAGADIGTRKVTFAFDFLGTRVIHGDRVFRRTYTAADGAAVPQISFGRESYNMLNGSAGVKFNLTKTLLATANAIFKLNDPGLRAPVIPMGGLSYSF